MGYAIREHSDDDQDPKEEFLGEYQEEKQLEIQDIQLEAGMPQDTANKNLCKHTLDSQNFLVTPNRGMAYIHGTATKMNNSGHRIPGQPLPNWEKKLLPTKGKSFKSESGKMKLIGTIIKEKIILYRKGNIRLNPKFVVLEDDHIQELLMRTDYQRMYGISI
ncbi:hypothetical protein O181_042096 [Austropuccinia psidii MF-1]|uniref:Uncharacterized protein n=1 Tax=Austropuccinia psidii MF-1 TaxID=1389203 RepID=A0A9Q3DE81_9BASI|nr:hypothetical protein [Austropuccinia psidii MF-1]